MDVPLNNEEFIRCKRLITYLEVCHSQACAFPGFLWLEVVVQCSLCAQPGLALLAFPQNLLVWVFFPELVQRHIWATGAWVQSALCGGGPWDSPPEPGQHKTLCTSLVSASAGAHHPSGLQTPFFFLNCRNLGSVCRLRRQTSVISVSKLNCPCRRNSVALEQLLVKPTGGRGKTEGVWPWKRRLSLLTSFFRWSNSRNISKSLM